MASYSSYSSGSQSGDQGTTDLARKYMEDMWNWAQGQVQQDNAITDQIIGDLLQSYDKLMGTGNTLMGMYQQFFQPEYQQLVQDANSYASTARIMQNMGAAQSGVAQSFNAQRNAALADLQGFGIDPSSGRYAELDNAERMQQAAAMAGAGFQAEQATEATGRQLRSEALQLGSVMPSQATAAYGAATGAANAGGQLNLARANTNANVLTAGAKYGDVAQKLSRSSSSGGSHSDDGNKNQRNAPNQEPRDREYDTTGNGKPGWGMDMPGPDIGGVTLPPPPVAPPPPTDTPVWGPPEAAGPWGPSTAGQEGSPWFGPPSDTALTDTGDGGVSVANWDPSTAGQEGSPFFGPPTDSAVHDNTEGTDTSVDPYAGSQDTGIPAPNQYTQNEPPAPTDTGGGSPPPTDTGGGEPPPTDTGGGTPNDFVYSSGSNDTSSLAKGGAIPYHASPSHGRDTDDVAARVNQTGEPIRVNAGEFIMPRHAVNWKGEKFFRDLIKKSAAEREKAKGDKHGNPTMRKSLPAHEYGGIPAQGEAMSLDPDEQSDRIVDKRQSDKGHWYDPVTQAVDRARFNGKVKLAPARAKPGSIAEQAGYNSIGRQ